MSWSGVKQTTNNQPIINWCDEMGIENYTINDKGEIDVNGSVWLNKKDFKELPYKFGKVNGRFSLCDNKNITSLKNCPNEVGSSFDIDGCFLIDSLKGCPEEVGGYFYCGGCKREFTEEEVKSWCKVKREIWC